MSEIRLLNVVRTLIGDAAVSGYDDFATIGANWSHPAWTLDLVASSGIIVAVAGQATTSDYNILNTARFADQAISLEKYREVTLTAPTLPGLGQISILMDMDPTTPVPAKSVRMRVNRIEYGTGLFADVVNLNIDEVTVITTVNLPLITPKSMMRMSIDSTNTIRCYWTSEGVPDITHRPTAYSPPANGGRVGIGLKSPATAKTSAQSFTFRYTPAAVVGVTSADLPPRSLVASAAGKLYVELKNGNMAAIPSPVRTLASDRLLSSASRLTQLYIADYALRKYGTIGATTGTTFTDADVASWSALGVDPDDDRLEILSGTGAGIGIYEIASISGANLTLGANPGAGGIGATVTFTEPFNTSPLGAPNWSHPGWTLDSVASSGLPTVADGYAKSAPANILRTAVLVDQNISTASFRQVSVKPSVYAIPYDGAVSILMDMNNTTPLPSGSVRCKVGQTADGSGVYFVRLYVNDVEVTAVAVTNLTRKPETIRLSIDESNIARCYATFDQAAPDFVSTTPDISYALPSYTAAGGRVGFGLDSGASIGAAIVSFSFLHTLITTTNGSSIVYRVCRAPKIFDSAAMTLTLVPIGGIPVAGVAVSPGQYPLGCTIVSAWDDRLIWAGDPLFPHVVYMSKSGDPDNYLYANETEGEAFAYDPARVAGASQIGDAITAIIPHSYDYCIFAGYRSFSIQRGDPTIGGSLDLISRDIGIIDKHAWCYTPEQVILGLSRDGLYLFQPDPNVVPIRVSRERLPAELLDIATTTESTSSTSGFDVQLAYDVGKQGVHIFVTPKTPGATTHWWFDWGKKAFLPESYLPDHEPTACCVHTVGGSESPRVIFGCRDGYLRMAQNTASTDDGQAISSSALLGPFQLGSPTMHGLLHRIWVEFARQSGSVLVDILIADTPERARYALPAMSFSIFANSDQSVVPTVEIVRLRGGACFIRLTGSGILAWALESMALEREVVGMRR